MCPSKCQTPFPCSFAFQAVRRSHYALNDENPTKQNSFSTDSRPTLSGTQLPGRA